MASQQQHARQDQGHAVDLMINHWLIERQELISRLVHLTEGQSQEDVDAFRDVLVDYISAGHFEIFAELEAEAKAMDIRGVQLLNALYPHIQRSTDAALNFDEHCDYYSRSRAQAPVLKAELSHLGELLADRFQLEDQLIEFVHKTATRMPYQ